MANQLLRELEAAAQIILAPPDLITHEQRQSAETVFLNFRKTESPYQLCRDILETSTVDYVLFEAADLIKTAIASSIMREWSLLPEEDITLLRQYLLHYVISKTTLATFVRERILQVIAIMVKSTSITHVEQKRYIIRDEFASLLGRSDRSRVSNRGYCLSMWSFCTPNKQTNEQERTSILNEVEGLISCGDRPRQLLGCSIISALMQEYAITVKSSDVVELVWETHLIVKRQFEETDLKRILIFSVGALTELTKDGISESNFSLIKHLLCILENVLVWRYVQPLKPPGMIRMIDRAYETDIIPDLRLSASWRDVLLDPAVIDIFFTLYLKVRSEPQLIHHSKNCLVQLASLSGTVFSEMDHRIRYSTNYIQGFLKLVCNIDIIDQEASGIAWIIRKIMTSFSGVWRGVPKDLLRSFMEEVSRLTCLFAECALQKKSLSVSHCMYMEAYDIMRGNWRPLSEDVPEVPKEFREQKLLKVFCALLKYQQHIASKRDVIEEDVKRS